MKANENPAPRANAESRAEPIIQLMANNSTTGEPTPDLAVCYIAKRFGLSFPLAALVARLADLGGALA